jgi:hypothetical protein
VRNDRGPGEPVEPIATVIGVLLVLMAGFLLLSLLFRGRPFAGPVCTAAPASTLPYGRRPPVLGVDGLARGTQADLNSVLLCVGHPGAALRLASLLAAVPFTLVVVVFLLRLRGLLLVAGRPGVLYSAATAARVRWLGWCLFAGSLAAAAIESSARTAIFLSAVHYPGLDWYEPQEWHLPIGCLLLGVALISVARVMRIGALRRAEESRVTI